MICNFHVSVFLYWINELFFSKKNNIFISCLNLTLLSAGLVDYAIFVSWTASLSNLSYFSVFLSVALPCLLIVYMFVLQFEYQQAQLEAEVENLSWKVERAEITHRGVSFIFTS